MKKLLVYVWASTVGLFAFAPASAAADFGDVLLVAFGGAPIYGFFLFVAAVGIGVYFMKSRDERAAPLDQVFRTGDPLYSVESRASVAECARIMTTNRIGALMVMDQNALVGIFTERDALGKVLAAGRDPSTTEVCDVMTRDPFCIPPTTTVGEAMELVTTRRFRHLPIVQDGKVLALVSSGDLTHWLVKNRVGDVGELIDVDVASRS